MYFSVTGEGAVSLGECSPEAPDACPTLLKGTCGAGLEFVSMLADAEEVPVDWDLSLASTAPGYAGADHAGGRRYKVQNKVK